jgi:hypothetical protein
MHQGWRLPSQRIRGYVDIRIYLKDYWPALTDGLQENVYFLLKFIRIGARCSVVVAHNATGLKVTGSISDEVITFCLLI